MAVKGKLRLSDHGVMFWCKGCKMFHSINLDSAYHPVTWEFNGDYEKPTIHPSIQVKYPYGEDKREVICHSYIIAGKIQYLLDCTHEYAGKTIDLVLEDN